MEAGLDRGQRPAVVEVNVGDQRHRRLPHDLGQRVRRLLVRHGDAHDFAAELRELVDLRTVDFDVRRVGAGHRLHDDRGVAADLYVTYLDLLGFASRLQGSSEQRRLLSRFGQCQSS